jgi:hypothetical protein
VDGIEGIAHGVVHGEGRSHNTIHHNQVDHVFGDHCVKALALDGFV